MPLGVVCDNDWEEELTGNKIDGKIENKPNRGRSEGSSNIPEELRKIIGETGSIDGRQEALAISNMFGVSPSSTSAYTNGTTSTKTYNEPKQGLSEFINKRKLLTTKRAQSKLLKALDYITEDKLSESKAIDLANISKAMSSIVKDMEPESTSNNNPEANRPTIVIYAPQIAQESYFGEPIVVND